MKITKEMINRAALVLESYDWIQGWSNVDDHEVEERCSSCGHRNYELLDKEDRREISAVIRETIMAAMNPKPSKDTVELMFL